MIKRILILCALLLLVTAVSAQEETPEAEPTADVITTRDSLPDESLFTFVEVLSGLNNPLFATGAGDGSGRVFVMEQTGRIWILEDDILKNTPFIDLSNIVSQDVMRSYSERGLLGLAFHPNYSENGYFFVNYTNSEGTSVVARYSVSADDPDMAEPESAITLLTLGQPYPNHNGGHMSFGPDGYLYISFGDGGAADDPLSAGQNPSTLLGTILRIDVDTEGRGSYLIPEDNPYTNDTRFAREVWAYGLRNVWRFSFDAATGDLYLADVGQNVREEVNFEPADSPGGVNYGWPAYEASARYIGPEPATDVAMPIAEYTHSNGSCSITGGYVYRGEAIPDLQGYYLYSDYCSGQLWAAYRNAEGVWESGLVTSTGKQVSSFGQGDDGELYVIGYDGTLLRIEASTP